MQTATQRIPVLVTMSEKGQIIKMAKDAGLSMGELLRRAVSAYRPSEDDRLLEALVDQMHKATTQAGAAIDQALALVDASNKRIAALERKAAHGRR